MLHRELYCTVLCLNALVFAVVRIEQYLCLLLCGLYSQNMGHEVALLRLFQRYCIREIIRQELL